MSLRRLRLTGLRNLATEELGLARGVTLITGANGAGKTSILEGIHILGRGRSFRSARLDRVRTDGQAALRVQGQVEVGGYWHRLGVGRDQSGTRARLDGADAPNLSALARLLPVQVINSESERLVRDGPAGRRSFLNWTVFHVEPDYHAAWQRADRALRQRNAALRAGDRRAAEALESEVSQAGEVVHALRERTVAALHPLVDGYLAAWLPDMAITVRYRRGWTVDRTLAEALVRARASDEQMGYTTTGPQRADLAFRVDGMEARERLSRGQQKLLVLALLVSQVRLLGSVGQADPLLLVDDLPAELDSESRAMVVDAIAAVGCQTVVTAIESQSLRLEPGVWFHVEQGTPREMLR